MLRREVRARREPLVSKRDTRAAVLTPRKPQGTSATGGSANSRSASEQGDSAKREKPCEQGRRHLVVN